MKRKKINKLKQSKLQLLNLVYEIWQKNKELRLCQLIGNCFPAGDLYYMEDKQLATKLKEVYK